MLVRFRLARVLPFYDGGVPCFIFGVTRYAYSLFDSHSNDYAYSIFLLLFCRLRTTSLG